MNLGPTQNYDDPSLREWAARPRLALLVRALAAALPFASLLLFGLLVDWVAPGRLGLGRWTWFVVNVLGGLVVYVLVARLARRLLPLSTLLRLSLIFPDEAPPRLSTSMRKHSASALHQRVERLQAGGAMLEGQDAYATDLLTLVAALDVHDSSTRGHSERVQAYASMIAEELKLSREDVGKVRWAALLHDIGKLKVPSEVLNRAGRPTEDEWHIICTHPTEGLALAEPLADWLGPWSAGIGQHHERWDGCGYPGHLAGTDIHLCARIIAVADTFDVITSARPYKKPIPAAEARAELARCADAQFDPQVVRAFLAIGIGRLRAKAGAFSALAALPRVPALRFAATAGRTVTHVSAGLATAVVVAVGVTASQPVVPAQAVAADHVLTALSGERLSLVAGEPAPTAPAAVLVQPRPEAPVRTPAIAAPSHTPGRSAVPSPPVSPTPEPSQAQPEAGGSDASPVPVRKPSGRPPGRPSGKPAAASLRPDAAPPSALQSASAAPAVSPCDQARAGSTNLAGDDLGGCDLSGRTLTGDFSGADLAGANLSGATLGHVNLNNASLRGADLRTANIHDVSFDNADLTNAQLDHATIEHVGFIGSNLGSARLSSAHIGNTAFTGSNLVSAQFDGVTTDANSLGMTSANLSSANLQGADLTGADLSGATLRGADIRGLNLSGANLRRANFTGATGTPASTAGATWDTTTCPSGAVSSSGCF